MKGAGSKNFVPDYLSKHHPTGNSGSATVTDQSQALKYLGKLLLDILFPRDRIYS
jgi:hypothetical protein